MVMEEIDDFMDTVEAKLDRLGKNLRRLEAGQVNAAERRKLADSCDKEAEKAGNDIRSLNFDLKRLPKDREPEYSDKLASLKAKLNKHTKALANIKNGGSRSQPSV